MHELKLLPITIILVMLFVGCQSSSNNGAWPDSEVSEATEISSNTAILTPTPFVFNTVIPEYISIRGVLVVMNPLTAMPDLNDAVYLVPMSAEEENITTIPPINDQALQAQVDEVSGKFLINNVKPGQYAVVVRERTGVELPVRYSDRDSLVIITLNENDINQIIDLGFLLFP